MRKNIPHILQNVVSPFDSYCSGCGMQPSDFYVTTPLVATGVAPLNAPPQHGLDKIVAFDRAEGELANITQINMVTVSSFNGLNGAVLGYDLLPQALRQHPLVDNDQYPHVYDATPLFEATQALYGTVQEQRFPIMPGQHVLTASKTFYHPGPCVIYSALALAIAEDRSRNADLYMEDPGLLFTGYDAYVSEEQQAAVAESLIRSVGQISQNMGVRYEKIFVGFKYHSVKEGEVGCALAAAPYVHLAKNAIPNGDPQSLQEMPLREWQEAVSGRFPGATSHFANAMP